MSSTLAALRAAADTITRRSDEVAERFAAVERALAGRQYTAASDAGAVTATTDWRSDLVDIDISAKLTRTRGTDLANQVVQAVNRARAQARDEIAEAFRAHAERHPAR